MDSGSVGKPLKKFSHNHLYTSHSILIRGPGSSLMCSTRNSKEWRLYIQVRYFQRTETGLTLWSGFSFHFRLFIMRSFKLYHKQFKISEPIICHSSSKNRSPILKEYTYLLKAGFTSSNKTQYANLVTFPNSLCSIDSFLMGESLNFP